jgi:hypothetical protein
MKGKYLIAIAVLCAMALALAGCMLSTGTPLPTTTPAADAQGLKATPPGQLFELESAAEDIINDMYYSAWAEARQMVDTIKKDLAELEPDFQKAGVPVNLTDGIKTPLVSLEQQVIAKNTLETKALAIQIIGVIPDILDYYQVTMPTDLVRLDYLGHKIALNAEKGDWTAAANNIGEMKNVWARLKPTLNGTAQKSAAGYEASINTLSGDVTKRDANAVASDLVRLLKGLDALEIAYD